MRRDKSVACSRVIASVECSKLLLSFFLTSVIIEPILLMSHPVLSNDPLFYHLDEVQCIGNENLLSDCVHGRIGVHNCYEGVDEAGVICSGEISVCVTNIGLVTRAGHFVRLLL